MVKLTTIFQVVNNDTGSPTHVKVFLESRKSLVYH